MSPGSEPPNQLTGKVALITGGAQGIGGAIVSALAGRGAKVVSLDREEDASRRLVEDCAARGWEVVACSGDVSNRADVRRAVATCRDELGRLDMVAAVAGTSTSGSVLEVDEQAWRRVLGVNLDGVLYTIQEAAREMLGDGGSIVVVASTNAFWVETGMAAYNASKGGVVALAKSAAVDLAQHGIRVNVVAPGVVETRLARFLTDDPAQSAEYLKGVPLGRFATVEDVAKAAAFLLSDDAAYVTGHTLVLDGGSTAGVSLTVPEDAFPGAEATGAQA